MGSSDDSQVRHLQGGPDLQFDWKAIEHLFDEVDSDVLELLDCCSSGVSKMLNRMPHVLTCDDNRLLLAKLRDAIGDTKSSPPVAFPGDLPAQVKIHSPLR